MRSFVGPARTSDLCGLSMRHGTYECPTIALDQNVAHFLDLGPVILEGNGLDRVQ
jgi:hypothetical protein